MGIFDGILICSDIDGTFEMEKDYPMPRANIDAVKYFVSGGGRFSFCTGRLSAHLKTRGLSELINAPACLCNGSIIYDFEKDRIIKSTKMRHTAREIIDVMKEFEALTVRIPVANETEFFQLGEVSQKYYDMHPNKMVWVFEAEAEADRFMAAALERFDCYDISKSWPFGVEFVDKSSTKGTALDYIKEYVGAHTSVGIGNYGNDLSLLRHADISVAVNDAEITLKQAADVIVNDCKKDAIADLIFKIEKYLLHGDT